MAKPQWQETKYRRGGVMTLVSYLLTILVLWWLLRSYFVLSFSGSESAAARAVSGTREMDVVGIAVKPTCVTEFSIEKLNEFVKPRLIHVFTPTEDKCELFRRMADNVKCYTNGEVIPNVSKKSVEDFLVSTFGKTYTEYVKKSGKKLSGWYLQQVSGALQDLAPNEERSTETSLSLSLAVALPRRTVCQARRVAVLGGQADGKLLDLGPGHDPDEEHRGVHAGRPPQGHDQRWGKDTHTQGIRAQLREPDQQNVSPGAIAAPPPPAPPLTDLSPLPSTDRQRRLEIAPDGTSFVTHSLPATKRHMEELLVQFEQGEPGSWPWKILGAIDPDYIGFGFSEYASYVSWMLQNHPNQVVSVQFPPKWSFVPPKADFLFSSDRAGRQEAEDVEQVPSRSEPRRGRPEADLPKPPVLPNGLVLVSGQAAGLRVHGV